MTTQDPVEVNSSILNYVKLQMGIYPTDTSMDPIVLPEINSAFAVLSQIGIGSAIPLSIEGDLDTWDQFDCPPEGLEMAKQYVSAKVREAFDPPSGVAADALKRRLDELEWRLSVVAHENETKDAEG